MVDPSIPNAVWLRYRQDDQVGCHVMAAFLPAQANRCCVDNMSRVPSNVVGANIFVPVFLSNRQRLTRRQYDVKHVFADAEPTYLRRRTFVDVVKKAAMT